MYLNYQIKGQMVVMYGISKVRYPFGVKNQNHCILDCSKVIKIECNRISVAFKYV